MRVAAFETEDWEARALSELSPPHEVVCTPEPLSPDIVDRYGAAEVISGCSRSTFAAPVLAHLPDLKLIAARSTGFDHIDLSYCRAHRITVSNVPNYGDETVAECAFALLLAVSRRVVEAADRTRRGDFSIEGLRGFDLSGRTLGVVGGGRIGQRVIAIAQGFGMRVLLADPVLDPAAARDLGVQLAPLDEVLAACDVLTLHVPGGEATKDLIGERELNLIKPGAVLINTARGGVVNATALVRALTNGRLAGAGLDVLAEESLVQDEAEIFRTGVTIAPERLHALLAANAVLRLPNVVVTPHIAYYSEEAVRRIMQTSIENITSFAAGAPRNVVT